MIYFDRILEAGNYTTIWLLGEPGVHQHPVVQQLLEKFADKAIFRAGQTAEEDFQFISFASNIVLTPSTFGWWAAFFAVDGDCRKTIHFPIMPMLVPMTWCDLVGGFDGSNVIFHD